jgi:hypothetical protein
MDKNGRKSPNMSIINGILVAVFHDLNRRLTVVFGVVTFSGKFSQERCRWFCIASGFFVPL